jgi:hypothetical protein
MPFESLYDILIDKIQISLITKIAKSELLALL